MKIENQYISLQECSEILGISKGHIKDYIMSYDKEILKIAKKNKILKSDVEEIIAKNEDVEKNFLNLKNAANFLNTKEQSLFKIVQRGYFRENMIFKKKIYLSKKELEKAKKEKEYYSENYYTDREISDLYKRKNTSGKADELDSIECPLIMFGDKTINKKIQKLYLKKTVDAYFQKQYIKSNLYQNNKPSDPSKIFNFIPTDNKEIYPQTYQLFSDYNSLKISASNASKRTKEKYSRANFSAFQRYCENAKGIEIFEQKTNDLIDVLNFIEEKESQKNVYSVAEHIARKRICKYDIKKIKNPNTRKEKKNDKEIYSFEDFILLYQYINNYKIHLKKSIEDYNYANVWLYLYMHLNNAWRHSDILDMPPIQVEMLGIKKLEDVTNIEINLPVAQMFLNNLSALNMKISKTGMDRNFFFSKDISVGITYSMAICELHRRKRNNERLIYFNDSRKISKPYFSMFFEESKSLKNFKFSSLKMNRSLMEHLFYSIQKQEGEGNSAFEMVKKIRNHKSEVTKEYIRNTEKSTELTKDLFDRGEFGYIYSELINVVANNKKIDTSEKTKMIKKVKEKLTPSQVEGTFAMMNAFENEKESIINKIYSMDGETAFEYIRKIYLKEMPSKVENMQCLSFPSCHAKGCEYSCFSCPFAIPNAYSINSLKLDIMERVNKIKTAKTKGTIKKENRFLNKSLDLLAQAIVDFGENYVWTFFENGEETLEKELSKIE